MCSSDLAHELFQAARTHTIRKGSVVGGRTEWIDARVGGDFEEFFHDVVGPTRPAAKSRRDPATVTFRDSTSPAVGMVMGSRC